MDFQKNLDKARGIFRGRTVSTLIFITTFVTLSAGILTQMQILGENTANSFREIKHGAVFYICIKIASFRSFVLLDRGIFNIGISYFFSL